MRQRFKGYSWYSIFIRYGGGRVGWWALTTSSLSPCIKQVTSFYPVLGIFIRLRKVKLRFQNCKEKNVWKSIPVYYFKKIKVCKWTECSRDVLEDLGIELWKALKDQRVDLGENCCVTDSWSNGRPASLRGGWDVLLQRALLWQYVPYFSLFFFLSQ